MPDQSFTATSSRSRYRSCNRFPRTFKFRTVILKPVKSHRINRPVVIKRAHNPKVASSNLAPATKDSSLSITSPKLATIRMCLAAGAIRENYL
jgi:hypothetical protein